jgi:Tfp pilus assembly protein PilF
MYAVKKVRESHAKTSKKVGNAGMHPGAEKSENGDNVAELAERRFQEGAVALQQGQTNAATSCFSAAARMAPKEPKYRAYFGRALAANPKTRRLAEAELQAAVKLDPGNASYHVMLAALYRDLGFALRAVSELDRALSIDPQHPEARQMLSNIEQKK